MQQYRRLQTDWGVWHNPYLSETFASNAPDVAQPTESGDQAMARILAQYSRAELDRGGWKNPFVPSAAAGNPIAAAEIGAGVTLIAADDEQASGDELLMRIVSVYTRATLDRGGWENPFVPAEHYASGNALLAVQVGEGVTTFVAMR